MSAICYVSIHCTLEPISQPGRCDRARRGIIHSLANRTDCLAIGVPAGGDDGGEDDDDGSGGGGGSG